MQVRLAFKRFFDLPAAPSLEELRTLTPADSALVRRRAAIQGGKADPVMLLGLLAAESDGRIGGQLPVGFGRNFAEV